MTRAIRIAFALLFLLAAGAPVAAQSGKPSAATRKKAVEHYEKAKAFQEAGRYAEAIAEYDRAHDLIDDPAFLYNAARCLHLSGQREKAIEKYEEYLEARPTGEIADEARSFADELRSELAAAKAEAEEKERAEAKKRREEAARLTPDRAARAGSSPGAEPGETVDVFAEPKRPAKTSTARRVAWISVGAGLVAGGVLADTLPESGDNGTLDATDFLPVALYAAGLAAVAVGIF
jgi:tetratricopeptide (TPR) repeat protein